MLQSAPVLGWPPARAWQEVKAVRVCGAALPVTMVTGQLEAGRGLPAGCPCDMQPWEVASSRDPCAMVLDLESGGPQVGVHLHPLASVSSSVKWLLPLQKIPAKHLACNHSVNGGSCHYLAAKGLYTWLALGYTLKVEIRGLVTL